MNRVEILGRITKDLELKQTNSGLAYVKFTVAVNKPYQKDGGEKQADFINCVAWRKTAEVISQYFGKGHRILLEGSIQTGSYDDKNGVKHYTTDVLVDKVHFIETKSNNQQQNQPNNYNNNNKNGFNNNQNYQKPQNQMPNQQKSNDNPFADYNADINISSDDLPF